MIILHIHIYPTSDQEAIDVVNELNRIYPEAKKNAEGNVEIEITLDRTCSDLIIDDISKIISDINLLDFKDKIYFNRI